MPNEPTPILTVACLCAAWCGVCREYRAAFDAATATRPGSARYVWIDVEDEADRLGDLEVETFPTLVIVRGATALFAGPVTPLAGVLERLIDEASAGRLPPLAESAPELDALVAWVGTGPALPSE